MIRSLITVALLTSAAPAEPQAKLPSIAAKTEGLERRDGFLTHYLDPDHGRIWLQLPPGRPDDGVAVEAIYVEGLASGLGSNPVGLDRGQLGGAVLVQFRRVGNRVLVEQPNLEFRADSDNPAERRAVRQSFATSVLWAGEIAARDDDGTALVDLTPFLVRDAHGVTATLERTEQGSYALDPARSTVDFASCWSFPDNVELEAILTYGGAKPGNEVRSVTPTPQSITLVQHHSFVRLPAPGYRPRAFDPRAGSFAISFRDYAAPLDEPIRRSWIVRHRLHKVDPGAARSRVTEPIVYHIDRGAPEPVRGALLDGARWWAAAFDAAGFVDAFRVELLPEDAHPLDVRYNVIQWVHRSTRGWSYGGGVIDPRTGEMIKGHVSLGSLRLRQDRRIFEGLLGAGRTGSGAADDPVQLALARIRQLSAHEVGHTLGLTHNFIASTYADRASVMDYPAPRVGVTPAGDLDVSGAYGVGVGAWDVHAIRWAYSQFSPGSDETIELEKIVSDAMARGLRFITDHDARPPGAAHPLANLWDNGNDPVAELHRVLDVRAAALRRFGERNAVPGTPRALLEETLVPIYFYHRYQLDAAAKVIGGLDYDYTLAGDGRDEPRTLDPAWQQRAIDAVFRALEPGTLDMPDTAIAAIVPRPFGHPPNRETFRGHTAPVFDPLAAARAAADAAVGVLLQPERCQRLVEFHRRDPLQPSFDALLGRMRARVLANDPGEPRVLELERVVRRAIVDGLLRLSASDAPPALHERVETVLADLASGLRERGRYPLAARVDRFLDRSIAAPFAPPSPFPAPPGPPIGAAFADPGCSWDSAPGL